MDELSSRHRASQALISVVEDNGRRVAASPDRLRGMLDDTMADAAGAARAELDAILAAARTGVAGQLAQRQRSGEVSAGDHARSVEELVSHGTSPDLADFALRAWHGALGLTSPSVATGSQTIPVRRAKPAAPALVPPSGFDAGFDPDGFGAASSGVVGVPAEPSTPSRSSTLPIVAAVVVTALLMGLVWFWYDNRKTWNTSAHADHSSAASASSSESMADGPPHMMPAPTPVSTQTLVSRVVQVKPGTKALTLISVDQTESFTPLVTSAPLSVCQPDAGRQNVSWCQNPFTITAKGTVTNWSIKNLHVIEQHGGAKVVGRSIIYTPFHNGTYVDHITYQLVGEGLASRVATITIRASCNTHYACH